MTMQPSHYQQAIYDFVQHDDGNAVVEAVAGSGKTYTAVHMTTLLQGNTIFVAFNKHIADELKTRVAPHIEAATCHSVGNRFIRQANPKGKLEQYLVNNTWDAHLARLLPDRNERAIAVAQGTRLISLIKATLTPHDDDAALLAMAARYDCDLNSNETLLLNEVRFIMQALDANKTQYDFDDMIYRSVRHGLIRSEYDNVLVDEAQDLNRSQIEFVKALLRPQGRLIAVGDRRQSIYGFRGADYDAIPSLTRETDAVTLPLSITYRCPVTHVELARTIVPQIEAAPNAKKGTINHVSMNTAQERDYFVPGSLVLCRTNAPLASLAYKLISRNVPVIVRGRDIGQGIVALINKLTKKRSISTQQLGEAAAQYHANEVARLSNQKASELKLQSLDDKIETLNALCEGLTTSDSVIERVARLFQDTTPANAVVASSIHRAKGLEADNVSIIRPDLLPLRRKGQSTESMVQESNIQYVAYTRSKSVLNFIAND